jgi:hypothetical protein
MASIFCFARRVDRGATVRAEELQAATTVFSRSDVELRLSCRNPKSPAGRADGHTIGVPLTSYSSIRKDLENAGATWVDQEVVTD